MIHIYRGATTAENLGYQGLGPNTGALAPCARPKAGLGVGCCEGHPRKIFENSDAKSCILVTTCCEIFCSLTTTAKKLRGPIHCWSPNLKVGDQSPWVPMVVAPMHIY